MKKNKVRLGVNVDHAATLRQVRGGTTKYPDMINVVRDAIAGGADLITIHLREDRRHIQESDVKNISQYLKKRKIPLNLESAVTPAMLKIALKYRPDWVCLVPEKREELTTEGGLDSVKLFPQIKKMTEALHKKGIKVSLFIDPNALQVKAAMELLVDGVEFHTGHWVLAKGSEKKKLWKDIQSSTKLAYLSGLSVHAGHGLDYKTTKEIKKIKEISEVNIGHSLICYSLDFGLKSAVKKMKTILNS